MSEAAESLKLLVERRAKLIRRKEQLLVRQKQKTPGPRVSHDELPGTSTSLALAAFDSTIASTNSIEEDFHDFPSDDSIADPDFVSTFDDLGDEVQVTALSSPVMEFPFHELQNIGDFPERAIAQEQPERKRKKKADKESWTREKNKKQRMLGMEYLGFRKINGKYVQDASKPERKLEMACTSQRCISSKVISCNMMTEEMRQKIFKEFWAMTWGEKKIYVLTLIDVQKTNRKTNGPDSRRSESKIYHLKTFERKIRVCQSMFLATLGIKEWTCRYWLGERSQLATQGPSVEVSTTVITKKTFILTFLQELPKLPSHYCRKSSTKLYLEPIIKSKAHLYRIYVERASSLSSPVGCRKLFEDLMSELNIALFKPKKDECDTCCAYKVGNITEEEYEHHVSLKTAARQEKNQDKESAIKGEIHVLTADLQAVMLSPCLNASAVYFKTKICVHNFTVYNLGNHQATCYWFDETVTDLKSTTYASFFVDYLSSLYDRDPKVITIYSDGCSSQNRNNVVANALLRLAVSKNFTITQKFLEKGHTQMECDSVHSVIERKLKNREIYLPSQYAAVSKEARMKPFPYDIVMPDYTFFKDYALKDYHVYDSIRPGRAAGDRCVTDIRVLRYNSNGSIDYKLIFSEDYMPLPRRPKPIASLLAEVPQLHDEPQKITKTKFNHLQDLKAVIPKDCHYFYDNLTFHD